MFRQRARILSGVGAAVWLAVLGAPSAAADKPGPAPGLNTLRDLKVLGTGGGAQVVVVGDRQPTFTVFRLSEPDRLVVDLTSADATSIRGHHDGNGPVSAVVASQFSDARASVGRVMVALNSASKYDVKADGTRVVISIDGVQASSKSATAPEAPVIAKAKPAAPVIAAAERVNVAVAEPVKAEKIEKPVEAPAAEKVVEAAPTKPENVVAAEVDEQEVTNPASRITSFALTKDMLKIATDGEVAKFELIELSDPPRLALDVYGVGLGARAPRNGSAMIKDVRVGAHADKVRVVVVIKGSFPAY
jgi:type IV pilus assembly protein PilQ